MEQEIIIENKEGIIIKDLIGEYTVLTRRKDHAYLGLPQYYSNIFFKEKPVFEEKINIDFELAIGQHEHLKSLALETLELKTL
jgi:hypothetical protein